MAARLLTRSWVLQRRLKGDRVVVELIVDKGSARDAVTRRQSV
jgi:hypothetical protein